MSEQENYWWGQANLERPKHADPKSEPTSVKAVDYGTYTLEGDTTQTGGFFVVFDACSWGNPVATTVTNSAINQYYQPPYIAKVIKTKPKCYDHYGYYSREDRRADAFYRRTRTEGWDNVPKQSIRACSCKGRPSRNYRPRA
jgi:hypothetical protein